MQIYDIVTYLKNSNTDLDGASTILARVSFKI